MTNLFKFEQTSLLKESIVSKPFYIAMITTKGSFAGVKRRVIFRIKELLNLLSHTLFINLLSVASLFFSG